MSGEANRLPALEWSHRAGAGELDGLEWVDALVDPSLTALGQASAQGDESRPSLFRHVPYAAFLPPPAVRAAMAAQARGEVSGWEVMLLLYARVEWLLASRRYLWSPQTPVPALLSVLVETFGIGPTLHRNAPERLGRLAAMLPVWHAHRGTVAKAVEVLDTCGEARQLAGVATLATHGEAPTEPALQDEVFACHDAAWWSHRVRGGATPTYRVEAGLMRFQPKESADQRYALQREDVLVDWKPGGALPIDAVRLLPAWMSMRLTVSSGRS